MPAATLTVDGRDPLARVPLLLGPGRALPGDGAGPRAVSAGRRTQATPAGGALRARGGRVPAGVRPQGGRGRALDGPGLTWWPFDCSRRSVSWRERPAWRSRRPT